MFLLLSLACFAAATAFFPTEISDTPLSAITLRMLFCLVMAIYAFAWSLKSFGKSLEVDRIWPWRWTLPYLGNALIRGSIITFVIYGLATAYAKATKQYPEWLVFGASGCGIIFVMFSSEFDFFKEKAKADSGCGKDTELE